VARYAGRVWENTVRLSLWAGTVTWPRRAWRLLPNADRPASSAVLFRAALRGAMSRLLRDISGKGEIVVPQEAASPAHLLVPPVLYATLVPQGGPAVADGDTPRDAKSTLPAQEIFDTYGLRPEYVPRDRAASRPVTGGFLVPLAPGASGTLARWLARAGLARHVTLEVNDQTAEAQIALIKSLFAAGERIFCLRIDLRHDGAGAELAVARLRQVCAWFFEDLGGLPGNQAALAGRLAEPTPAAFATSAG
jgi:hypothetical protein